MVRYRNVSTSRLGFVYLVYLAIALRSMARLVCGTSSTLRLSFFQYGSIALISGVAAGRNFSVRPSVISTSRRIIFARCCGALSSIMQILPNLRTAALRNLAKACISNLSYCLNILLPSVVSSPNTMVFECEPVYTYDARTPLLVQPRFRARGPATTMDSSCIAATIPFSSFFLLHLQSLFGMCRSPLQMPCLRAPRPEPFGCSPIFLAGSGRVRCCILYLCS